MDMFKNFYPHSHSSHFIIPDALEHVHKRYTFHQVIGHGSFSKVRKCRDKSTHEWFACKIICKALVVVHCPNDAAWIHTIQREVANIRAVQHRPVTITTNATDATTTDATNDTTTSNTTDTIEEPSQFRHEPHPHIVELIDVYEDNKNVYIITELCSGGELYDQIVEWKRNRQQQQHQALKEADAAVLLYGILDALAYLHDTHSIAHRDLKPSNFVLWKKGSLHVKIVDFGLSMHVEPKPEGEQRLLLLPTIVDDDGCAVHSGGQESVAAANAPKLPENDGRAVDDSVHTMSPTKPDDDAFAKFLDANSCFSPCMGDATFSDCEEIDDGGFNGNHTDENASEMRVDKIRNENGFPAASAEAGYYSPAAGARMNDGETECLAVSPSPFSPSESCDDEHAMQQSIRSRYGTMTSEVGTPYYVAPEVLLQDEYTCISDMWSIGVIAYLLLSCGNLPFQGADERQTVKMLMEHTHIDFLPTERWANVSPQAQDFCRQLLQKDPSQRPSASEALSHPWLTMHGCGKNLATND